MHKEDMYSNISRVKSRIAAAASRSGRNPDEITLIGVSKYHPIEALYMAVDCGITILGENRVQEMEAKKTSWQEDEVVWHMLGHLQRNKIRKALELFDCIQSVDNWELAAAVERILSGKIDDGAGRESPYPVFVEVNTSGEASKHGLRPEDAFGLVGRIKSDCPHIRIEGLMTIGPLSENERDIRSSFSMLRSMAEKARQEFDLSLKHLSMGMSGDFEIAIEEGSTLVRIGTDIFGARAPMSGKSNWGGRNERSFDFA